MCIPGFVFQYLKKLRRNWRPKVHYTAMSCSRRGPWRYGCGQTIAPTAMICTFLESPTNLDVHPRKRFALFGQNRRNLRRRNKHLKYEICSCGPDRRGSSPVDDNFFWFFFLTFWYVGHYLLLFVLNFREIGQN